MSNSAHEGGLTPPPSHPSRTPSPGPSASYSRQPPPLPPRSSPTPEHASSTSSASPAPPPPLPPRPSEPTISVSVDEGSGSDSDSDSEGEGATEIPPADPGASAASLLSPKEEEALSEVQLRDLYDDEEIDRFLHLFSLYVREVRVAEPVASPRGPSVAQAASASAPAIEEPASPDTRNGGTSSPGTPVWDSSRSLSERIAHDFLLPLLPAPRPPPPEFTLGRLKQTAQRLYVAVEPFYSWDIKPLLKLATWKDPRRSFVYCGLYWTLWYHGLLFSAAVAILLYHLISRKLHPYPSLSELREHRKAIDRSQTFGTILSTRLATSPALGLRDMWDLFGDYKHMRKLKKAKKESAGKKELDAGGPASLDDNASVRSVSFSTPDLGEHQAEAGLLADDEDSADLKRLGLFIMNEAADFLERVKNIFLWRQPGASTYYGVMLLGWFFVGLIPAHYMVRLVGFFAGSIFWHVIPVLAAIPEGEWSRIPPPLRMVPTDTEYAMELISQRVARGLPVRPKRGKKTGRGSSEANVQQEEQKGESSSVDWNKWGGRIASTKERAGDLKQMFQDGQWKQADNWKALNPLTARVVAPQGGSEPRIETKTFPAQLKKNPGLITLTPTTLFFTPLLSSRATVSIPLDEITGVKKTTFTKGVAVSYTQTREDGSKEAKDAEFMFVASRGDLFARLVSWGGRRWERV
ncbi:hypothetical protein L227DRAFT_572779 [Lentinus tigrinus ALCF2SS1-6]|uniref:Uncharacterized protein n=1 Tax=Lentinus tigrinus ALCF2SS1-6 TaxID=1328759 RepID=A0A5C2SI29_9APHY|nr:hypothetical protein L227DRAFT_572779 [Lentinus tigrinus ALCF2SS1-6]